MTYQVILYKANFIDSEWGWQIDGQEILWKSQEYQSPSPAMQEWDFFDATYNNWFVTMVERKVDEITDQEIFDSSVIKGYDGSPL